MSVGIVMEVDGETKQRTSLNVYCTKCGHAWIGLYLPMPIGDAAKAMGRLCCPMCAADAKQIRVATV